MTKLEEVARAMARRRITAITVQALEQQVEKTWRGFEKDARAAVEALREPTLFVIEAEPDSEFDLGNSAARAKAYWHAMIDAILNEKAGP